MMFSHDGLGDQMFDFAKLLLFISFGYSFIAFYEAPLPGIGVSFSNLITDQAHYFQSVLEARAFDNIYRHFDELSDHFLQPDAVVDSGEPDLLDGAAAHRVRQGAVARGDRLRPDRHAPCARCSGPIFVPFFIVPKLDWLFWGWLQVVHPVLVRPGRRHRVPDDLRAVRLPLRDDAAADDHVGGVRHLRASRPFAVVVTFCVGILLVPSLTQFDLLGARAVRASCPPSRHQLGRSVRR